jgi:hypothetical protein
MGGRSSQSIVMGALVACCVLCSGCGDKSPSTTQSTEWRTLRGSWSVSLSLPAFFNGGDPADSKVMNILVSTADSWPHEEEHEYLTQSLDFAQEQIDRRQAPLLMAFASPDGGVGVADVRIGFTALQNLTFFTDGDSSMRALLDAWMDAYSKDSWELVSLGDSQASVIVRYEHVTEDTPPPKLMVLKPVGDLVYMAWYECPEKYWDAMLGMFKKSSETLVVR